MNKVTLASAAARLKRRELRKQKVILNREWQKNEPSEDSIYYVNCSPTDFETSSSNVIEQKILQKTLTIQRRATKLMENETEDIYSEVDMNNLKSQNYHEALRGLCNRMSMRGIVNFIHYDHCGELLVEIKNTTEFYNKGFYSPVVDFVSQRLYLAYREDLKDL